MHACMVCYGMLEAVCLSVRSVDTEVLRKEVAFNTRYEIPDNLFALNAPVIRIRTPYFASYRIALSHYRRMYACRKVTRK